MVACDRSTAAGKQHYFEMFLGTRGTRRTAAFVQQGNCLANFAAVVGLFHILSLSSGQVNRVLRCVRIFEAQFGQQDGSGVGCWWVRWSGQLDRRDSSGCDQKQNSNCTHRHLQWHQPRCRVSCTAQHLICATHIHSSWLNALFLLMLYLSVFLCRKREYLACTRASDLHYYAHFQPTQHVSWAWNIREHCSIESDCEQNKTKQNNGSPN